MNDLNGENNLWLFFISIFSFTVIGLALFSQYFYDYQPCAWCVLQRLIFFIIGFVSLGAFIIKANFISPLFLFILGCAGQLTAGYQYFYASKSESCSMSLAEQIIQKLNLDITFPGIFEIRAMCADAINPLFGLNYEIWSFMAFFLICIFSMGAYLNRFKYF